MDKIFMGRGYHSNVGNLVIMKMMSWGFHNDDHDDDDDDYHDDDGDDDDDDDYHGYHDDGDEDPHLHIWILW